MDSWNPFYSHQSLSPDDQPSPPVAETKQQHSGTSSTKVSDRQVGQPFLFRQPQLDDAFFQTPGLYPTTPTDLALTCHSISSTLPSPDVYNLLGNVENPASHSRELPAAVSLQHSALDSSAEWHDDAGTQAFSADGGLGISSQLPGWTRSISTPSSSYQPLSGFPIVPAGPAPMFSPIASTTTPVYPFQWTNHIVPDNHACPDPTMTGLFPNTTFANMAPVASLDAPALPIAAPPAWSVALSSQHSPLELLATPALSPADTDSTLPQTPHPPQLRRLNEPRLPGHFHPYLPPSSRKLISQTEQPATSSGRKSCREMTVACLACSRPVFRLYKRGTAQQLDRASQNHYRCQSCSDQSVSAPLSKGSKRKKLHQEFNPVAPLVCDVCRRVAAYGGVLWDDEAERDIKLRFDSEFVCEPCAGKYKKCSDCGGGGGRRGAGKWRAKELFEGRKTCNLSHARATATRESQHQVFDIDNLQQTQLQQFHKACGEIFRTGLLSTMAVPEMMEFSDRVAPPISTFEALLGFIHVSWLNLGALLFVPPEGVTVKRYLSIRVGIHQQRKELNKSAPSQDILSFGLYEYEYRTGINYVRVICPWSTGDGFDASVTMIDDTLQQAYKDRQQLVTWAHESGMSAEDAERAYPQVGLVWTMLPFAREARIISWMERKRDFVPLEQFLKNNPDVSKHHFPPTRPTPVPHGLLDGFTILVKRVTFDSEKT